MISRSNLTVRQIAAFSISSTAPLNVCFSNCGAKWNALIYSTQRCHYTSDTDQSGSLSKSGTSKNHHHVSPDIRERFARGPGLADFIHNSGPLLDDSETSSAASGTRLRLPEWLKTSIPHGGSFARLTKDLRKLKLHTVCEEARCPNIGECWSNKSGIATATIMVMGDTCTRGCRFCSVKTSNHPPPLDPDEPAKTAEAIASWAVNYTVITSVDRDDLIDGGARHIADTIRHIKARRPEMLVEALVPDFAGNLNSVATIVDSSLEVYAHNLETVEGLQSAVRDRRASYRQSLRTLEAAKEHDSNRSGSLVTKSSLMLGLGETDAEVHTAMTDLRRAGVDCLTLGQYIQPTKRHLKVKEYIHPDKFNYWKEIGESLGFSYTASGPLVRSSYRAGEYYIKHIVEKKKSTPR